MPEIDGAIRIVTKITTKDAEESLSSLEYQIKKSAKYIDSLRSKMDALKDQKIPTKAYTALQEELSKAEKELTVLIAQQEEWEKLGIASGGTWDTLNEKIATASDNVDAIKEKMQLLVEEGKGFTLGSDTAEYASYARQIKYEEEIIAKAGEHYKQLQQNNSEIGKYQGKLGGIIEQFSKMKNSAKSAFESIRGGASQSSSAFSLLRNSASKAFSSVSSGAKQSSGLMSKLLSRLKSLAVSAFIFNLISKGFNSMVSSMKTGFTNIMGYSSEFANSIQSVKNSLSTLGNQIAAAFAPIVQEVIPWLNQLISVLSVAISYVAQFIAALSGSGTYIRAKKVQDSYNSSLGGTASKADDAADATDNMADSLDDAASSAKKARDALAQFDDLDVLEKQDDEDNTLADKIKDANDVLKDLGSGAGGAGDLFEEVPIDNFISDLADKFKDILSQLFAPLKEAWEREGQFVIDSWKYALEEVWQLIKDIGRDFLIMWNEEATIQMFADVLHIIGDIGLIIGNIAYNLDEAWNKNQVGLQILENIRDIFTVIIHNIREAADYTVEWSKDLDFYPLLEALAGITASLVPLADNLSKALIWLYENALLPIGKWAIEDALPASIDALSAAIDVLNAVIEALKPLGTWLWENFLQPLGQWAGEVIIAALEVITDLLTKFADWISEHQDAVQNFVIILGSFAAAWGIVSTALSVVSGIMTIASIAAEALGAAIAFLTSPVGIVIAVIGALIAIGVLLYKNWDTIKEKAGELKDWLIEKWEAIKEWFSELPEKIGEVINAIVQWFDELPEKIGYALGFALGKIIEWREELFAYLSEKIPEIIENVFTWFSELPGKIYDAIMTIGDKISEWKDNVIAFFAEKIPIIVENVVTFFEELPGKLIDIGQRAVEGIWEGIQNAKDWLVGNIKDFCGGFVQGFKDALGIHSPSTVMTEQGEYLTEGLLNGIAEKIHLVSELWVNLKEDMISVLQSMGDWFTDFWAGLFDNVSVNLQNIQLFFLETWTAIYEITVEIWTGIQEWFIEYWTLFIELLTETWENILLVFTEKWEEIQLLFNDFINFLNTIFIVAWKDTWKTAEDLYQVFHDLLTELTNAIKKILTTFMDNIVLLVNTKWKDAWHNAQNIFVEFKNRVEEVIEELRSIIQEFYDWVMALVEEMLNALASVGSAVSGGGGSGISTYNIVSAPIMEIPHLASGSVIRGGNPFPAILGDQPHGQTNIEAPLSTIRQAVREELSGLNYGGGVNATIQLNVNGEEFARLMLNDFLNEMSRQGYDVDVLGVT